MQEVKVQPLYALAQPDAGPVVYCTVVYNPLDPLERTTTPLVWEHGRTLGDYLDGLPDTVEWAVCVNAEPVARDEWGATILAPNDFITLVPEVQRGGGGGGGGKNVMRLVAMIAVAVIAAYAAPYLAGYAMGIEAGSAGMTAALTAELGSFGAAVAVGVAGTAISLVGGMVVNALMPPPKAKTADDSWNSTAGGTESPSYGIDGAKNTSTEDVPCPVPYGTFRQGGNIINMKTVTDGNTQHLYMMLNLGEGPIESISDVLVNDQPLANFTDVEIKTRLGTDNQELIDWFDDSYIAQGKGVLLSKDNWITHTTLTEVDKFRVDVVFPGGLCNTNATSGAKQNQTVTIEIQYRQVGNPSWSQLGTYPVTAAQRAALRKSFESPALPQGKYEIRVRRIEADSDSDLIADDVRLADVWEVISDDVAYNFTALLALKIKLTDQLSGIPKVTALVKGRKLNIYDAKGNLVENKFNANPAWVAIDIMTHTRYGGAMRPSRLDFAKWKELADYCDLKGLEFNAVFDFNTNVWEALQNVMRVGHAQVINVGTRYSVAIEKPDTPVMMFSVANIIEDSFSIEWLSLEDRANEIEIAYYDREDEHRRRTVKITDDAVLDRGDKQRPASIALLGVTSALQAYKEAYLQLALNKFILQSVSFEAPVEAIACTVGDLVFVQHDMPKWGDAGRCELGCTASVIKLDRPVQMVPGRSYKALLHFDALKRGEGVIQHVIGTSLFVSGLDVDNLKRVRRLICNGRDVAVTGMVKQLPYVEVVVESTDGMVVGQSFELWDTDALEERAVVVPREEGEFTEITLAAPLTQAPNQFANWMFGEASKIKKPFRVLKIEGSGDITRGLRCLEYNESVYEDPENAMPTPNYSDLSATISQVRDLSVVEELYFVGTAIRTRVYLSWAVPLDGIYGGADVYASINNAPFQLLGSVGAAATVWSGDMIDGDKVVFKVIAKDPVGGRALFTKAPTLEHTIVGKAAPPSNVTNFKVQKVRGGMFFQWDAVPDIDVIGYEIRRGAWDDRNIVIEKYAGTSITVGKAWGGRQVFHIVAVDSSGNYSAAPTTFVVNISAPSQVRGFDAIQNLDIIQFVWEPNKEDDVVGYEIREGGNWGSGSVVATNLAGSRFSLPSNIPADRQFWIKAIDAATVYSDLASGALSRFSPIENHNVVFEQDEHALGYPGTRINLNPGTGGLVLKNGAKWGEYVHGVTLPEKTYARNVLRYAFDAVLAVGGSWKDSNFAWNSDEARKPWQQTGDLESVLLRQYIALEKGLGAGDIEAFTMDGSLAGAKGAQTAAAVGISYAPGRFRQGLYVKDTTDVAWDVAVPAEFSLSFWMRPKFFGETVGMVTLTGPGGVSLALSYDARRGAFKLADQNGEIMEAPSISIDADTPVLVAISQTNRTRRFLLGRADTGVTTSAGAELAPAGAFTHLRLN